MTAPAWRLVLNGKAAAEPLLRDAVATLRGRGIALGVRVTWEAGDVDRFVDEAIADGVDSIVAAGGDGTLSAVAAALAHRDLPAASLPSLGLVPLGTANDFAAATGIPEDVPAALELVAAEPARAIDLLRIEAGDTVRWAANLASGGFGTRVTVETSEGMKKLLGGLAYLVTGMSKLGRIDPIEASVRGPGFAWSGGFIALGVGNGRQAGGGQALCPDAILDDGLLDLTIVPTLEGEVAATVASVVADGKEAALERVAIRVQLPWLEIAAREPFHLNLDGEPLEAMRFRIECVPARVRMHLPRHCPLLGAASPPPAHAAVLLPQARPA